MEPPVRAVIEPHIVDGRTLVVAEIPETSIEQKPCYYPAAGLTNGAFIRVADGDHKLSAYEVQMLLMSRGQPREDERPVPEASIAHLDSALVAGLLERLRGPDTRLLEPTPRGGRTGRTRADRRPAILALLAEHGELSRAEIAAHLGLGEANAR